MAVEHSIIEDFNRLCKHFTPEKKRATLSRPLRTRAQIKTQLKRKLYDTLFSVLKNKERSLKEPQHNVIEEVKTEVSWIVFQLRQKRKFDDANKLEHLLTTLSGDADVGSKFAVVQFMLLLKNTAAQCKPDVLGHDQHNLPLINKHGEVDHLPEGPLCYGDTKLIQPDRFHYMHYPRCVFEAEPLGSLSPVNQLCEQQPGSGLCGNGWFGVQGYLGDQYEQLTTHTLFGGLVHGHVSNLDVKLALPELPDESCISLMETRIPKSVSAYSMELVDEGFKSQEASLSGSTHDDDVSSSSSLDSAFQSDYDTSIYERCLTENVSQHYTWESIGRGPGPRTKPFLSHAGPEAFDRWNMHLVTSLKTAFPMMQIAERHEISQRDLMDEMCNVLIAVPSVNFMLDMDDQCFLMRSGLYMSGVSSEALEGLLEDFLTCGMFYYRLGLFAATPQLHNSLYHAGLTFQAFTEAVQTVLQYYRGVILSIDRNMTLLQLQVACHNLFNEIRFLATLCHCNNPVTEETKDNFPNGIKLLSYLYDRALDASFTDHYPLMLSLLKHSCTPYFIFVQEWVYHGVYRDVYGEFMIQVNADYLRFKDKHYWTHGFTLNTDKIEDSVPLFLKHLAKGIFICGKSINLLKACDRNHFICDVHDLYIPRIRLTFSETELRSMKDQCDVYASKMKQISQQALLARQELKERAERAKQDLIVAARKAAAQEHQRIEDKIRQLRQSVAAKKRKQLHFLKTQMENDIKRKSQEKVDTRAADKAYIDSIVNRESAMDDYELELERQAREEVVAYYSQLTEEAARREQKALWHVRRAKLNQTRRQFLAAQEQALEEEMAAYRDDPSRVKPPKPVHVEPASAALPGWAQRGLEEGTIQVTGDEEEDTGADEAQATTGATSKHLPPWALKGMEKYGMAGKTSQIRKSLTTRPASPSKTLATRPASPLMGGRRQTPPRRSLNTCFHVNDETQEQTQKSSIQTFSNMHATKESTPDEEAVPRPHVKQVQDRHASTESMEEPEFRPHVMTVGEKHVTQQSEGEAEYKSHIKSFPQANKPSEEPEHDNIPRLKLGTIHSTTESKPMEWKIKKQNIFGHISEMSSAEVTVPRIKKSATMSATRESDWSTDYCIKPRIRINRLQTANTESEQPDTARRAAIKMNPKMSATKESEYVDHDKKRLQMFKERNQYGHAADSSVQKLLYVFKYNDTQTQDDGPEYKIVPALDKIEWLTSEVQMYEDNFDFLDAVPEVNLMSSMPDVQYGSYGNYMGNHGDIEGYEYLPLSAVLQSSVNSALHTQVSLVNESLVNYFMSELQITEHFRALRRYLCMGDGDFSEILCDNLMEKLGTNPRPSDLVNPMFLNNCLNKAVRMSVNADDKYADNVSFIHKYMPRVMEQTSPDVFDCIQLHYEVQWPLNIVITKNSLHKYSQVFSFMLQLKRLIWVLKDVWHRLKRDACIHKVDRLNEFRELHLFRQEMQLFVKVMQEYIAHQIVEVTWQELQNALKTQVHNLDDLHAVHNTYLDNALFRCLLTKKAAGLMKVMQDTFGLILKFHKQLTSAGWHVNRAGVKTHRHYIQMKHSYSAFHKHSKFLFNVVAKLAERGYEPHFYDLLLRLNFNNFYDK